MRFAALLALAFAVSGQAQTAKESALGKALAADVEKRYKPLDDPVVADYVNALGKRLSAAGTAVPLTIRLVSAEEPVAAAFPGGYLVLSSGLIRRAGNESELAGMMAHQIAHIAARHGAAKPASAGSTIPITWNGICTRMNEGVLLPMALRQSSLKWEVEADALAREYLEKAGYDAAGLTAVFQRLHSKPRPGGSAPWASHGPAAHQR